MAAQTDTIPSPHIIRPPVLATIHPTPAFRLTNREADLFTAPQTVSLAHCVGQDVPMGAGIAVDFVEKLGHVSYLKKQHKTGQVAILRHQSHFIYYLVTKRLSSDLPRYADLEISLRAMKENCVSQSVQELAMSRIGCGLDRLKWHRVKCLITKDFGDTDIQITICYPPNCKAPKVNAITRAQAAKQVQKPPSQDTTSTSDPSPDTPPKAQCNDRKRSRVHAQYCTTAPTLYHVSQHPDLSLANFQH